MPGMHALVSFLSLSLSHTHNATLSPISTGTPRPTLMPRWRSCGSRWWRRRRCGRRQRRRLLPGRRRRLGLPQKWAAPSGRRTPRRPRRLPTWKECERHGEFGPTTRRAMALRRGGQSGKVRRRHPLVAAQPAAPAPLARPNGGGGGGGRPARPRPRPRPHLRLRLIPAPPPAAGRRLPPPLVHLPLPPLPLPPLLTARAVAGVVAFARLGGGGSGRAVRSRAVAAMAPRLPGRGLAPPRLVLKRRVGVAGSVPPRSRRPVPRLGPPPPGRRTHGGGLEGRWIVACV